MNMGSIRQTVSLSDGASYPLRTYGDAIFLKTTTNVPIHGAVIGDTFFSIDTPLRCLNRRENPTGDTLICHDGTTTSTFANIAEVEATNRDLFNRVASKSFDAYVTDGSNRNLDEEIYNDWTTGKFTLCG